MTSQEQFLGNITTGGIPSSSVSSAPTFTPFHPTTSQPPTMRDTQAQNTSSASIPGFPTHTTTTATYNDPLELTHFRSASAAPPEANKRGNSIYNPLASGINSNPLLQTSGNTQGSASGRFADASGSRGGGAGFGSDSWQSRPQNESERVHLDSGRPGFGSESWQRRSQDERELCRPDSGRKRGYRDAETASLDERIKTLGLSVRHAPF